jgi:hypothetical protein
LQSIPVISGQVLFLLWKTGRREKPDFIDVSGAAAQD